MRMHRALNFLTIVSSFSAGGGSAQRIEEEEGEDKGGTESKGSREGHQKRKVEKGNERGWTAILSNFTATKYGQR